MPPKRAKKPKNNIENEKIPSADGTQPEPTETRVLRPRLKRNLDTNGEEQNTNPTVAKKTDKSTKATAKKRPKSAPKTAKVDTNKTEEEPQNGDTINKKSDKTEVEPQNGDSAAASTIYKFKANTIEGKEVSLEAYKGHVCIIVNVASKCGHTAVHYKELVQLHQKYAEEKGLKILAFPCNQFGKQEPGDKDKICEFVKKKNVEFDVFEKIEVNGESAHPLWLFLCREIGGPKGEKIDWNFTKFLVDKEGKVVGRFKPGIKPSALEPELEKLW